MKDKIKALSVLLLSTPPLTSLPGLCKTYSVPTLFPEFAWTFLICYYHACIVKLTGECLVTGTLVMLILVSAGTAGVEERREGGEEGENQFIADALFSTIPSLCINPYTL